MILTGDIGGTYTRLAIFTDSLEVVRKQVYENKGEFLDILNRFKPKADKCCLAVAGPVEKNKYCRMPLAGWEIKADEIEKAIGVKTILINDFEAVGYAVNVLRNHQKKHINNVNGQRCAPVVVLGAGTGLGKVTLTWQNGMYRPIASEFGWTAFPPADEYELRLCKFIEEKNKLDKQASWGDILSGRGLESIYEFLQKGSKRFTASEISKKPDSASRKAISLFAKFFARGSQSAVLDSMALGGLYITGGVCQKNPGMFDNGFTEEFQKSDRMAHILSQVPIYLITTEDAGLIGAGYFAKYSSSYESAR